MAVLYKPRPATVAACAPEPAELELWWQSKSGEVGTWLCNPATLEDAPALARERGKPVYWRRRERCMHDISDEQRPWYLESEGQYVVADAAGAHLLVFAPPERPGS